MSWLSSAVKSVRKATGLPPITIGNVVKAVATGGTSVVAQTSGNLVDRAKAVFQGKVNDTTKTITQARQASAVVDTVQSNKAPLMIAAAVVAYLVLKD